MPAARMRSWTSTLGTGDSLQPHIPLWDIQAVAYPYLSDSERRQIALEQGDTYKLFPLFEGGPGYSSKMIRIPISGNEKSDIDVCEDLAESSLIHVNATVDNTGMTLWMSYYHQK
ncbi:hypothetical protein BASA84_000120 [Batrachochytrium salamandrivorans]|nr:hypothetical protein BASA84_000120 [Batrachochytrium salamandrivorans]